VVQILELGSHHAFIAEVVHIAADSRYMEAATGKFDLEAAGLMAYSHGQYYTLGKRLGHFGFSVKKPSKKGRK
ncbi:MAG: flavin reductase family protein, partial [Bacteroidales bacterium]|nr:flavin reductase family protein [Bacteroidales bacterium]